jgi:hypothetical protein
MATAGKLLHKGIKDFFYETRVLMGREYSLRRFAKDVLGGTVVPVTLGCIEKGTRFPNEALVRRLAAIRRQEPHALLVLLWRDRLLYAFGKELRRVLRAPKGITGIADADLVVLVSHAIAALPDEGKWMALRDWRRRFEASHRGRGKARPVPRTLVAQVEQVLAARQLIEVRAGKVRRRGYHFIAQSGQERQALALEFCALFVKGLLDKLVLAETDSGTYLRNHYLHIAPERLAEFQQRLDSSLTMLADEFAIDASARTRFLNVLAISTPF